MQNHSFRFPAIFLLMLMYLMPSGAVAGQAGWPEEIRFGLIPSSGQKNIMEYYQPVARYLREKLGINVRTVAGQSYEGIIRAASYGQVDIVFLGPKSYVEATARGIDIEPLAMELDMDGNAGYHGVVITRKDSGIETLEQAKGHSFAFTDPNSTSGYLVPGVFLKRDFNIDPAVYFRSVIFSGSHAASIEGIKNGLFEVASTNTIDMQRMIQKGVIQADNFNIIWKSGQIPGSPICVRKILPESLRQAIRKAFLSLDQHKDLLEKLQIGGFVSAEDQVYDVIRALKMDKDTRSAKSKS